MDAAGFRIDILIKDENLWFTYGVLEAKVYSSEVYTNVQSQIEGYLAHLDHRSIAARAEPNLQYVYDNGWAVNFLTRCFDQEPDSLIAWVPMEGDPGTNNRWDVDMRGHVYFQREPYTAPNNVISRANDHDADEDYQSACAERLQAVNFPGISPQKLPPQPI